MNVGRKNRVTGCHSAIGHRGSLGHGHMRKAGMGSRGSVRGRTTGQSTNPVDDLCAACVPRTQSRSGVPGGTGEGRRGRGSAGGGLLIGEEGVGGGGEERGKEGRERGDRGRKGTV